MKSTVIAIALLLSGNCILAQNHQTRRIDSLVRTIRLDKLLHVSFAQMQILDSLTGKRSALYYYYFFDPAKNELRLVNVNENLKRRKNGKQVQYTFFNDELVKITMIPSRRHCKKCNEEYFVHDMKLIHSSELNISSQRLDYHLEQARLFQSKMPRKLDFESIF